MSNAKGCERRKSLWVAVLSVVMVMMVMVWGCSPVEIVPGQESHGQGEPGIEKTVQDSSVGDELVGADRLVESVGDTSNHTEQDIPEVQKEVAGTESTEKTGVEEPSVVEGMVEKPQPEEAAGQEGHSSEGSEMLSDSPTQDVSPQDQSTTVCESNGGYCDLGLGPCKAGYQIANDPMGCPGGRSALCCIPQAPPSCATDKDCPPICSGSGVCTQVIYSCVQGKCQATNKVSQPNATCDTPTGTCKLLTPGCKTHCDCTQGLMCVLQGGMGSCVAATKPVWCCDKEGCPVGESCTDQSGNAGTCPAAATDCEKKGGYCSIQGKACSSGYQVSADSCGPILSRMCCLPTTKQCKVDCDCTQGLLCASGQCIAGFAPAWCCDKSGCPKGQRCTDSNGNAGTCP